MVCLWLSLFSLMESFKDFLIRDKRGASLQRKPTHLTDVEEKNVRMQRDEGNQDGHSDEEIPDMDDSELPEMI